MRATFGANVRNSREAAGLRQSDLADALSALQLTRVKVAKIEAGTRPTTVDEAAAIAGVLGEPLSKLLGEGPDEQTADAVTAIRLAQGAQGRLTGALGELEQCVQVVREIPADVTARLPKRWQSMKPGAELAPEDYAQRAMAVIREVAKQSNSHE